MLTFLSEWGYIGLFIGSFLAATVVPFSADVLIIGLLAVGGNSWLCFLTATVGNFLGGMTSFGVGWLGRWEWIERWFHVRVETLERQKKKIDRWGSWLALLTWVPFVGDVFAVGLGFYRLNPWKCSLFMLIGKAARFAVWILIFGQPQ